MLNRGTSGNQLEKVSTKTGRLAAVQGPIRIWVDEEFTNFCTGGLSLDSRSPIPWGPLIQEKSVNATWVDKLWLAHFQNLAGEMERIYQRMTGTFGAVSDIDQNGVVELFISPDLNRSQFILFKTGAIDHFRVLPRFKIEDLALYNSQTNAASNEGEILYLWTPDPGGIYNQVQFPSANSLTSNYAKGFLSFQLFNLIYANEKLFVQKRKKLDELWLMQCLSLLASAYYAGNDFTVLNLAQYLTSRPQYISLSKDLDESLISTSYRPMANDEQLGMRTLFGWYLHNRLCGPAPTPCAKLRDIITSAQSNYDVLAALLGEPYEATTNHFATSVALGLLDKPEYALAAFDKSTSKEAKPLMMGNLAEIFASEPPVTAETKNDGGAEILGSDPTDRTVAGPYPSRQMLFAQPISPESGIEFKLAADSVVVLQPTGLIEKQSDITAMLGKGLKVIFVPIGDRDSSTRRIHFEKLSQDAHGDLRPDNLTTLQDPNRTYAFEKTYDGANLAVSTRKQLWIMGSIDNYKVNIGGSQIEISDSDAYNIEFRPCASAADVAACEAAGGTYDTIVQVIIKDFEKELAPMLLVTSSDRQVYRGRSALGRMTDILPSWQETSSDNLSFICPSTKFNRTTTLSLTASVDTITPGILTTPTPHGLTNNQNVAISSSNGLVPVGLVPFRTYKAIVTGPTTFTLSDDGADVVFGAPPTTTYYLHGKISNQCMSGGIQGAPYYSHLITKSNPQGFAHTYDNFLMLGLLGFPFNNYRSITYTDASCDGLFCFKPAESARQHYVFSLDKSLKSKNYFVYSSNQYFQQPSLNPKTLASDVVKKLLMLKTEMDSPTCVLDRTNDPAFLTECTSVAELTGDICSSFCARNGKHVAMDMAITSYINTNNFSVVCPSTENCNDWTLLLANGSPPDPVNAPLNHSSAWISPKYYNEVSTSAQYQETSLYKPIEPSFGADPYCTGEPGTSTTQIRECSVRADSALSVSDIRQQFNTVTSRIRYFCTYEVPTTQFDLCIDPIGVNREFNPEDPYAFYFLGQSLPTDRARQRHQLIHYRAGELVGKPERLQYVIFQIPATGGVAQVIVGGRKKSQGKYIIRARITDFDL